MILDILYFVIALGLIITIHELGHLILAKKVGIYCHEFCIGFGPKIFRFKKGETYYSLALLPIGGYVSMAGEEISVDDSNIPKNKRYDQKTVLERFLVAVAGVVMNFGLAFLLFVIVLITTGTPTDNSVVGYIDESSSSFEVLKEGDEITNIGGIDIENWSDIGSALADDSVVGKRYIDISFKRDNKEITKQINPRIAINSIGIADYDYSYKVEEGISDEDYEKPYIGFVGDASKASESEFKVFDLIKSIDGKDVSNWNEAIIEFNKVSDSSKERKVIVVVERIVDGESQTKELKVTPYIDSVLSAAGADASRYTIGISPIYERTISGTITGAADLVASNSIMIFDMISLIFEDSNGVGADDLGGVVSIFNMTSDAASDGIITFLLFLGMLSVNVAVLNLLPIPALDGGRIVFLGIEAIRGKKLDPKIENTIHGVFMLLLFGFMIYITIIDVIRWS